MSDELVAAAAGGDGALRRRGSNGHRHRPRDGRAHRRPKCTLRAETIPTASRVQHLVSHRHQRVIAQPLVWPYAGRAACRTPHSQIHRHLRDARRRAHRPRPHKPQLSRASWRTCERERPQKRPRSRGATTARAAPPPPSPTAAAAHRRSAWASTHQRLATRPRTRRPARTHHLINQRLQTQPVHHRARQQQPPISHQRPVIEHRLQPVDPTCYAAHRKASSHGAALFNGILPCQPFWWTRQPQKPHRSGSASHRPRDGRRPVPAAAQLRETAPVHKVETCGSSPASRTAGRRCAIIASASPRLATRRRR